MYQNSYYKLVVLKIPGIAGGNTGTQFSWNTQSDIRYARIIAIETFFRNDLSHAQPEPVPVILDADAPKITVTLETNDPDDIQNSKGTDGRFTSTSQTQRYIPATALHRVQSTFGATPAPFVRMLTFYKDLFVVWEKSFISIAPGGLGNTADVAFCMGVWYTFLNKAGKPIPRQ
jgi:hypothetical protein